MASDEEDLALLSRVWNATFEEEFAVFDPDKWHLEPTNSKMEGRGWHQFQDKAKVKFMCSDCGRTWTSMKGVVIFWYRLDIDTQTGHLRFKLFGQKCNECTKGFQEAEWYPEEVKKVLSNVHQKIDEKYYKFEEKDKDDKQRSGRPRKPHNKNKCEACQMGVCSAARNRSS